MSDAPFKIPTEFSTEEARKAAEKGLAQTRDAVEKLNSAAKNTLGAFDASASIVAKGFSEFNAKAFEAFKANSALTFEFFNALTGAKSVSDAAALAPAHAGKQFQALKDQTKDLSSLAQKIAQESAEPLKAVIGKTFQPLS
jgi:phasin